MDALPRTRRRSPGAVSVADLLCRYSTTPVTEARPPAGPPGAPVPVSALLRREGRARRALDRPLVPRGHSRPAPEPASDEPPRHNIRKATAAAGALFVVGAVFGTTALEEALLLPAPEADAEEPAAGSAGIDGSAGRPGLVPGPGLTLASAALPLADTSPVSGADIGRAVLGPIAPGAAAPGGAAASAPAQPGLPTAPAGPGAVDPGAAGPAPTGPSPVALSPAAPSPAAPSPVAQAPAPTGPAPTGSAPTGPAPSAPSPAAPDAPTVSVPTPDLGTPEIEVPGVVAPSTPLGPVATPSITVGEAAVTTPDLGVTVDEEGVGVATTDTAVATPDAQVGSVDVGPIGLGETSATLPDLTVEGAEVLQLGPEPELTVPGIGVSATVIETPPLTVGATEIDLPDVELPEVSTSEVPVVETVTGVLSGDAPSLGGLLG